MKYSSQIVIKKLDNNVIFYNKDSDEDIIDCFLHGKFNTQESKNVEWINDGKWVKKHYERKGFMAFLNDYYLYSPFKKTRSYREFEILNYLNNYRFKTCKPVIGWAKYFNGFLYKANLVTENIPGLNFCEFYKTLGNQNIKLENIYREIGTRVAELHNLSIFHGDLNINNIIIESNKLSVHIIDLDKSYLKKLSNNDKVKNIQRFKRSLVKNKIYKENYFQIFIKAYRLAIDSF